MKEEKKTGLTDFLDGIGDDDQSQDAGGEVTEPKGQGDGNGNSDDGDASGDSSNADGNPADTAGEPVADSGDKPPAGQEEDVATRLAKIEAENKRLEKRFKETQADWTRKNQELIDARKKLEELQAAAGSGKAGDKSDDDDDASTSYLTPKERKLLEKQAEVIERLEKRLEDQHRQTAVKEWEQREAAFKKGKEDYDDIVDSFQRRWENDEALKREFVEAGATPEAAYKIGKRLRDLDEMSKDPEAYKERLKQELRAELEGDSDNGGRQRFVKPLASVASKPPKGMQAMDDEHSPLSEALLEIQKR
jgi:hypothetical protein